MDSTSKKRKELKPDPLGNGESKEMMIPHQPKKISENLFEIIDENLSTLQKIHAILLHCINMDHKEKLEFANSQRYFMKLYLKKLQEKLKK